MSYLECTPTNHSPRKLYWFYPKFRNRPRPHQVRPSVCVRGTALLLQRNLSLTHSSLSLSLSKTNFPTRATAEFLIVNDEIGRERREQKKVDIFFTRKPWTRRRRKWTRRRRKRTKRGRHRVYKCITTRRPPARVTWSHVVDAAFIKYKVPGSRVGIFFSLVFFSYIIIIPFHQIGTSISKETKYYYYIQQQ